MKGGVQDGHKRRQNIHNRQSYAPKTSHNETIIVDKPDQQRKSFTSKLFMFEPGPSIYTCEDLLVSSLSRKVDITVRLGMRFLSSVRPQMV